MSLAAGHVVCGSDQDQTRIRDGVPLKANCRGIMQRENFLSCLWASHKHLLGTQEPRLDWTGTGGLFIRSYVI